MNINPQTCMMLTTSTCEQQFQHEKKLQKSNIDFCPPCNAEEAERRSFNAQIEFTMHEMNCFVILPRLSRW
jgi:hypothetical protein